MYDKNIENFLAKLNHRQSSVYYDSQTQIGHEHKVDMYAKYRDNLGVSEIEQPTLYDSMGKNELGLSEIWVYHKFSLYTNYP